MPKVSFDNRETQLGKLSYRQWSVRQPKINFPFFSTHKNASKIWQRAKKLEKKFEFTTPKLGLYLWTSTVILDFKFWTSTVIPKLKKYLRESRFWSEKKTSIFPRNNKIAKMIKIMSI